MQKTLFIDSTPEIDALWQRVLRPDDIKIDVNMGPVEGEAAVRLLGGYDTCIVDATYLDAAALAACAGLRHIVFLGTGAASYIDVAAAERLAIKVSTIKGYGDCAVAEHAMALVFAAARQLAAMDRKVRAGGWGPLRGMQLGGKTIGLIGLGGVGREMARLASGIGMTALAWNRSPIANPAAPLAPLGAVLARADVLSLHLGLNDETRHFMNRERLETAKPGVVIVNAARAGVIDETALVALLRSGHVAHYATDVFNQEPPAADDPLLALENVTLSAHAGYNTPEAAMTMYRRAIDLAASG